MSTAASPAQYAAPIPTATTITEYAADFIPSEMPDRITVAGPVWAWRATSFTTLYSSEVNHIEIRPMITPMMRPTTTAPKNPHGFLTPSTPLNITGVRIATPTIVNAAAAHVPRSKVAARLALPGRTRNEPIMDASIPIDAIIKG